MPKSDPTWAHCATLSAFMAGEAGAKLGSVLIQNPISAHSYDEILHETYMDTLMRERPFDFAPFWPSVSHPVSVLHFLPLTELNIPKYRLGVKAIQAVFGDVEHVLPGCRDLATRNVVDWAKKFSDTYQVRTAVTCCVFTEEAAKEAGVGLYKVSFEVEDDLPDHCKVIYQEKNQKDRISLVAGNEILKLPQVFKTEHILHQQTSLTHLEDLLNGTEPRQDSRSTRRAQHRVARSA